MNGYDQELTDLIARIKADKSLAQPWRNKAAARAEEVQAFLRMGKTTSYRITHEGSKEFSGEPGVSNLVYDSCICTPGMRRKDCPAPMHVA